MCVFKVFKMLGMGRVYLLCDKTVENIYLRSYVHPIFDIHNMKGSQ